VLEVVWNIARRLRAGGIFLEPAGIKDICGFFPNSNMDHHKIAALAKLPGTPLE
jgi:hypothetical protein